MNGNAMYEMARQRIAEQQRVARLASEARERRAAARAGRGRKGKRETIATPAIPDFAHEMFDATVPAPRESADGRDARTSR